MTFPTQAALPSNPELKRSLGLFDSIMIVAGSMIGSGIFMVSATMSRGVGGAGWLLLSWVISALLTLAAALSYGELAAMLPHAGGQYVYLREAYSPIAGFLYGWTLFTVIQTGIIATVSVGFARYLGVLVPGVSDDIYLLRPIHILPGYAVSLSVTQAVAIAIILVISAINAGGLRYGKLIQNLFTVAKLAALVGVIAIGLTVGRSAAAIAVNYAHAFPMPSGSQGQTGLSWWWPLIVALGLAQVGSLFAADAWNNITFTAGEVKNPRRNLPLSLVAGTLLVMGFYFLANLAYTFVLPFQQIAQAPGDRVGAAMLESVYPGWGGKFIAVVILIAAAGCVNGMILAGGRTYFAMARDGLFLPIAGRLNKANVPGAAIYLQSAWAVVLLSVRTYDPVHGTYGNVFTNLLDYVIAAALLFYIATIAAVFRLRFTRPTAERPYRTWGYPFLPVAYILGAALIFAILVWYRFGTTGPGLVIVLAGLPVYWGIRFFANVRTQAVAAFPEHPAA